MSDEVLLYRRDRQWLLKRLESLDYLSVKGHQRYKLSRLFRNTEGEKV